MARSPRPGASSPALSRRGVLQLGGSVALLFATGACAADSGSKSTDGKSGGASAKTLRIAVSSYLSSWDQDFVGFDLTALMLYKNVFPYLIDYGVTNTGGSQILDTQNITPTFAESFEPDAEQKVWTLKLRRGVKFASGNEMKAADVKWSKDRAFAAQANVAGVYRTIGLTSADQVKVVDDYTVEFHQAFPSALTRQIQAISLYVFDSVEAKKHASGSDPWAKEWFAKNPPTGGYFNVAKATQGQEIELSANTGYPGPDPAKTPTIRISVVPAASNQRLQLQAGDIDIALGISQRDIQDLKKAAGIKVISAASNRQVAIQMSVTAAPFNDVNIRKALAYAVPYEQIINNVYGGDARAAKSPVPLDMPGYDESGYPFTYDLEKAKAAMAAAGRASLDSELVFEADNEEQQKIAVQVQGEAAKAGIRLKLTPLDPATLGERRTKKNIPLQITSGQLWVDDVEYMLATSFVKGANLNYSNYSNPEIEQIYEKSHTTVDTAARNALWKRVQEILAADVPWVVICQPNFNLPVRESVAGWVQPMDGLARLRYLSASA
ncbi:ABC transporter substrate-binding protein [Micromonospora aurantiaca]|uniref:ABC transporter substrate-binding protein n=1 Tax=Micromonospora aurantiaca (nom. illeg.) TaxID=47850 RepID=A0A1C6SSI5_9ACTN|nr:MULTISPECIES: ABC transporter substrate-binding protein [Micromonospora]ADL45516.1 extracellular solute-binding protein family 5 [Micromonospora aurantiaca ATCC 27029]ADU07600.1 extracellular solute-binding protein family 5 [Micromonospora sp. L5]AXH91601.1 ABC transporter substrate-binding protein [Micromonospora aurantiaca]OHX03346.1 ABC transporter substrate-binding protein [Micromonospora sp. WMMB235]RNI06179.1 ABC transporter substrate-binding protein [Micromonospora aurantiaca]